MDLKSLFKKNSKQSGEPKSYDSLDSEFERSESTVNHPHTSYEISRQDHDSLNLDSATLSEETKDDFNAGAFGKNNGSHPFESLMKKTEESKEDGFGFSSRIERGPMVPNEDHDYTTDGTAFNRSNEDDEVAETNTDNTVSPGSVNSRTTTNNADATTDSNFEAKIKKLPLLGNLAVKRQYQIAGGLAALGLASFMTGTFLYINNATEQGSSLESVSILQTDAQKSDSAFSGSVVGKQGAYARLSVEFPKMVQESEKLTKFIDRLPSDQKAQLKSVLQKDIDAMKLNVESVNKNSEFLKNTADRVNTISNQIGTLIEMIDRVGVLYIQLGATPTEMADIYYLKTLLQTISENTVQILLSDNVNPQTMPDLIKARKNFRKVLAEIYSGNPSKGIRAMPNGIPLYSYKQLASTWVYFSNVVDTVVTRGPDLIKIRTLGTENTQIVKELDKHLISIKNSLSGSDFGDLTLAKVLSIISLIVLLTGALLIFFINTFEKDNRSLLDKIENNRTQTSIFRLLNEMTPLQDGDLTKKTTVTEEITGAIADSINATVDSLASLVKKIKDTSFTMRQKTNEVNVISLEMLKSSE
jgi:twitching motility protein PilJ